MQDNDNTKEQLINELNEIRQKVTDLEAARTSLLDVGGMTDTEINGGTSYQVTRLNARWYCRPNNDDAFPRDTPRSRPTMKMPLSPTLPNRVNSLSTQTDKSVLLSIGGSFLVSVKVWPLLRNYLLPVSDRKPDEAAHKKTYQREHHYGLQRRGDAEVVSDHSKKSYPDPSGSNGKTCHET
jgi:hypothetical protein